MSNPLILNEMRLQFGELNITPRVEERLQELDYTVQELQEAIANHRSSCDGEPSVYVGTYAKYNEGSLCGLWIDLSSFNDYDEFINFCQAIHADEEDPELMAQDFECFPRQWYNEGFMSEEDFDNILEYSDMCDSSRSALLAKNHGADAVDDYMEFEDSLDNFEEAYCSEWDSEEEFPPIRSELLRGRPAHCRRLLHSTVRDGCPTTTIMQPQGFMDYGIGATCSDALTSLLPIRVFPKGKALLL